MKHKFIIFLKVLLVIVIGTMIGSIIHVLNRKNDGKVVVTIDLDNQRLDNVVNHTDHPIRFEVQTTNTGNTSSWTFIITSNPK